MSTSEIDEGGMSFLFSIGYQKFNEFEEALFDILEVHFPKWSGKSFEELLEPGFHTSRPPCIWTIIGFVIEKKILILTSYNLL